MIGLPFQPSAFEVCSRDTQHLTSNSGRTHIAHNGNMSTYGKDISDGSPGPLASLKTGNPRIPDSMTLSGVDMSQHLSGTSSGPMEHNYFRIPRNQYHSSLPSGFSTDGFGNVAGQASYSTKLHPSMSIYGSPLERSTMHSSFVANNLSIPKYNRKCNEAGDLILSGPFQTPKICHQIPWRQNRTGSHSAVLSSTGWAPLIHPSGPETNIAERSSPATMQFDFRVRNTNSTHGSSAQFGSKETSEERRRVHRNSKMFVKTSPMEQSFPSDSSLTDALTDANSLKKALKSAIHVETGSALPKTESGSRAALSTVGSNPHMRSNNISVRHATGTPNTRHQPQPQLQLQKSNSDQELNSRVDQWKDVPADHHRRSGGGHKQAYSVSGNIGCVPRQVLAPGKKKTAGAFGLPDPTLVHKQEGYNPNHSAAHEVSHKSVKPKNGHLKKKTRARTSKKSKIVQTDVVTDFDHNNVSGEHLPTKEKVKDKEKLKDKDKDGSKDKDKDTVKTRDKDALSGVDSGKEKRRPLLPMAALLSLEGWKAPEISMKESVAQLKTRHSNQDRAFIYEVNPSFTIFGVFDGHGEFGHNVSDLISTEFKAQAVKSFPVGSNDPSQQSVGHLKLTGENLLSWLKQTFRIVETVLLRSSINLDYSGSTASVVVRYQSHLYVGYVGDSKVAGFQFEGAKPVCLIETPEHSPNAKQELERIHSTGARVSEVYFSHLNKKISRIVEAGLSVSRAFGDLAACPYGLISTPDFIMFEIPKLKPPPPVRQPKSTSSTSAVQQPSPQMGGWFPLILILASDGLWDTLSSVEAMEFISNTSQSQRHFVNSVRVMAETAWRRRIAGEGRSDDTTVIVALLF